VVDKARLLKVRCSFSAENKGLNVEMEEFWREASQKDVKETLSTQLAQANAIFDTVSDSVAQLNF